MGSPSYIVRSCCAGIWEILTRRSLQPWESIVARSREYCIVCYRENQPKGGQHPKFGFRSTKQVRNSKVPKWRTEKPSQIVYFEFRALDRFRISTLGFRASFRCFQKQPATQRQKTQPNERSLVALGRRRLRWGLTNRL